MLTGLLGLLIGFIAVLAVPVRLSYEFSWRQTFQGRMALQWLFGLVRVQFPLSEASAPSKDAGKPGQRKRRKTASRKPSNPLAAIRHKAFRRRIIRFVRDVWRAIHKENLTLHVRIGLDDPADTGRLWALVGPLSGGLATVQAASIDIEPDFVDAVFELDSSGSIRIVPLRMLYLAISLLLSPAVWHGIRQMRQVE